MVEINFDVRRPAALLDLNRVRELTAWQRGDGQVRLGAGVTYTRIITELGALLPGLAMAARTVGSPQIRNRGTVGGNLGAASPAGDCHPVLLAAGAVGRGRRRLRGSRLIPAADFFTGVKRNVLAPGRADHRGADPGRRRARSSSAKIGTRNAMVIAVCAFALELRPGAAQAGSAPASARPAPRRCGPAAAEEFLAGALAERGTVGTGGVPAGPIGTRFGELVAAAAGPSTTCAGPRPTAVTRSACWPGGP